MNWRYYDMRANGPVVGDRKMIYAPDLATEHDDAHCREVGSARYYVKCRRCGREEDT